MRGGVRYVRRWHVTASGVIGAWPSNQPVEAYNKGVKEHKIRGLRKPFSDVCDNLLPNLVTLDSKLLTEPINRAVDVVPPYMVKKASLLRAGDVGELSPVPAEVKQRVFYVNTKKFAMSQPGGKKVDAARIRDYTSSVDAVQVQRPAGVGTVQAFEQKFMSLHRVYFDRSLHLVQGKIPAGGPAGAWRCDCKGFWSKAVCAHVLKVKDKVGEFNIKQAMAKLPTTKGRTSQKNKGGLYRDS